MSPQAAPSTLDAWGAMLAAMGRAAWVVDGATRCVVAANTQAHALLGRTARSLPGADATRLIATLEDLAFWDEACAGHAGQLCSETSLGVAGGGRVPVIRRIEPIAAPGVGTYFLVSVEDISEACRQREAHEAQVAELQATLESTADGILVTDPAGRIRGFNHRFAQIWGLGDELLRRRDDAAVFAWMRRRAEDPAHFGARVEAAIASLDDSTDERLMLATGQELECSSRPLRNQGRITGRVWAFRDRTELAAAGRRIEVLSTTDALTGLANRHRIGQTLDESIQRAARSGGTLAVLVLDLDRFKQINDSLGECFGDQVLLIAAERLRSSLNQGDVVARVGDDRFALLVHQADHRSAESVARRVLAEIAQPCTLDGLQFTLTCSVGVALYPPDGSGAEPLLRHAETAMQRAKLGGRGCFRFHQPRHDADLRQRMRLDQAMRLALASHRFRLKYQPQVDLHSGAVVGAEALLRWRDPELGDVPPDEFIPVAEDTGFIAAIGDWVLTQAVRQAASWRRRGVVMPVAINVSALQFRQSDFTERVADTLRSHDLPGAMLELELTESILVHEADEALDRLWELSRLGVQLAIDDFGTGYSSLAYLKRFPIHRLKIDRRFIDGLPDDGSDAAIVRAIIQMSRALDLRVVAEGVETEAQQAFLQREDCDEFQGFLFAPALDALSFDERMRGQAPTARRAACSARRLTLVARR